MEGVSSTIPVEEASTSTSHLLLAPTAPLAARIALTQPHAMSVQKVISSIRQPKDVNHALEAARIALNLRVSFNANPASRIGV